MKDDKFNLGFRKEETSFRCRFEGGHRSKRNTHRLVFSVLDAKQKHGPWCINHWPKAVEEIQAIREAQPEEISVEKVLAAVQKVRDEYKKVRGKEMPSESGG